jgi:hypothetical protein
VLLAWVWHVPEGMGPTTLSKERGKKAKKIKKIKNVTHYGFAFISTFLACNSSAIRRG